jgi:hypothetical protein
MDDLPTNNISETLLEFMDPLLNQAADEAPPTAAQVEQMFAFGVMVWNTVALESWPEDIQVKLHRSDEVRARLASGGAPNVILGLFDTLVTRKRELFSEHLWAVGEFSATVDDTGVLRVKAEARLPTSMIQ